MLDKLRENTPFGSGGREFFFRTRRLAAAGRVHARVRWAETVSVAGPHRWRSAVPRLPWRRSSAPVGHPATVSLRRAAHLHRSMRAWCAAYAMRGPRLMSRGPQAHPPRGSCRALLELSPPCPQLPATHSRNKHRERPPPRPRAPTRSRAAAQPRVCGQNARPGAPVSAAWRVRRLFGNARTERACPTMRTFAYD